MNVKIPRPKTIEEFATAFGKTPETVKRELFQYVDLLMEMEMTDEILDCGLYHNHQYNSPKNMVESHEALLFAKYEHLCGRTPEPDGPLVTIDHNGISVKY